VPEPLEDAVAALRELLLDPGLRRAVAAGRRHGSAPPQWRRAELRPVDLKDGRRLQEVRYDERAAHTRNLAYPAEAAAGVDELLAQPYGNWHVESAGTTVQVRVTKRGLAQVHREVASDGTSETRHDRQPAWLLDPGDPLFTVVGADAAKRRQVDAFLRMLAPTLPAVADRHPLRVVDLGCGNAYLTFAAYRYLSLGGSDGDGDGREVRVTGVDQRPAARERNTGLATQLGWGAAMEFVAGSIAGAEVAGADVVLALHACDTATDEALARAVRWRAPVVVAAPCCHHETAAAVRAGGAPGPYNALTRHGVLRERFADVLTDALRALLLRLLGYRVDVVEFVSSEHTSRNVAVRGVLTGAAPGPELVAEYRDLVRAWGLRPALAQMLAPELAEIVGGAW
jgi:SAM-dependent methyltransferase